MSREVADPLSESELGRRPSSTVQKASQRMDPKKKKMMIIIGSVLGALLVVIIGFFALRHFTSGDENNQNIQNEQKNTSSEVTNSRGSSSSSEEDPNTTPVEPEPTPIIQEPVQPVDPSVKKHAAFHAAISKAISEVKSAVNKVAQHPMILKGFTAPAKNKDKSLRYRYALANYSLEALKAEFEKVSKDVFEPSLSNLESAIEPGNVLNDQIVVQSQGSATKAIQEADALLKKANAWKAFGEKNLEASKGSFAVNAAKLFKIEDELNRLTKSDLGNSARKNQVQQNLRDLRSSVEMLKKTESMAKTCLLHKISLLQLRVDALFDRYLVLQTQLGNVKKMESSNVKKIAKYVDDHRKKMIRKEQIVAANQIKKHLKVFDEKLNESKKSLQDAIAKVETDFGKIADMDQEELKKEIYDHNELMKVVKISIDMMEKSYNEAEKLYKSDDIKNVVSEYVDKEKEFAIIANGPLWEQTKANLTSTWNTIKIGDPEAEEAAINSDRLLLEVTARVQKPN